MRVLTAPRCYIRPCYVAYLLLGIVTAGMLPILLPLIVEARTRPSPRPRSWGSAQRCGWEFTRGLDDRMTGC
jgi:hypothetical protein